MIHKYTIVKNAHDNTLTIKEFAVIGEKPKLTEAANLTDEHFQLLFQEKYDAKRVERAAKQGKSGLISMLRTPNFYPIGTYADEIADSVIQLVRSKQDLPVALIFDDQDFLSTAED